MNGSDVVPRWNDEIAAILSGLIGGGRYGLKIRVPHALGELVHRHWEDRLCICFTVLTLSFCVITIIHLHKSTVMTFLFGGGKTFQEKIRTVAKLALEHSSNLAAFAGLYKVTTT